MSLFCPCPAASSFCAASFRSPGLTMLYRSNTERVRCPVNFSATRSGMSHAHQVSHGRTPAVVGRPTRARPPRTAAAPSSASQANRGRRLPPGSSAGRWQRPSSRCGAFLEPLAVAVAANHQTRPRCLSSPITPTLSPRTSPARSSTRPTPCADRRAARDQRRSAGACIERRAPWAEAPHQPARFAAAGRISSHHSHGAFAPRTVQAHWPERGA